MTTYSGFYCLCFNMLNKLQKINSEGDIPQQYRGTPIGDLIGYQNLFRKHREYSRAQILIGMCMDNRKHLNIPEKFAYIIRTGGANLRYSEFNVSYAIAVGEISHIALIGHDQCGMVNLASKRLQFTEGLKQIGWDAVTAEDHFSHFAPLFEIGNEIDFTRSEAKRIRMRYPEIEIAPLYYRVDENKLYVIKE